MDAFKRRVSVPPDMPLPTPNVTPCRPLSNTTNVDPGCRGNFCAIAALPTPPQDAGCKRRIAQLDETPSKRPKVVTAPTAEDFCEGGDVDMGVFGIVNNKTCRHTMLHLLRTASLHPPNVPARTILPSRRILQSFVSSHKSDVYTCHSLTSSQFVTQPYACAYSNGAKRCDTSLLAVATEEGSVMILNTSKRQDWEFESQRTIFQPHYNGIFDIKWNLDDSVLATASGDKKNSPRFGGNTASHTSPSRPLEHCQMYCMEPITSRSSEHGKSRWKYLPLGFTGRYRSRKYPNKRKCLTVGPGYGHRCRPRAREEQARKEKNHTLAKKCHWLAL